MSKAPCTHKGLVKFLPCSAADRYPGVFVCTGCDEKFSFDPTGKYSVRYHDRPNPKIIWKDIELVKGTGKG